MKLEDVAIQIRPRSYLDILDLSVVLIRRYWVGLGLAALAGVGPVLALNLYWTWHLEEPNVALYFLVVLLEIPWATAFITLYLGQVIFFDRVSAKRIISQWAGSMGQLLFFQTFLRGICVVFWFLILTTFYLLLKSKFMNEIILLERQRMFKPWSRTLQFHTNMQGRVFSAQIGGVFLGCIMTLLLYSGLVSFTQMLADEEPYWEWFELPDFEFEDIVLALYPYWDWEAQVALWITVTFFAVVRFLFYLDCRIRSEGWDVEWKLRSQAAKFTPEAW